jgi:hypothetical protein
MSPSTRVLWPFGVLGLLLCLSACGREVPAAVSIPQPTELEHVSTPVPSGQAPVTPTPVFTAGEPVTAPQVPEEEMVTNQPTSPSPPDPGRDPPVDQIEVLAAVAVVWPDASLGCAQPGMLYAQVSTPGYLVVLETKAKLYEYHASQDQSFVLCEESSWLDNPSGGNDGTVDDGWPNQPRDPDLIIVPPPKRR